MKIPVLRVDGGMSANPTFVQALADASGRPVEVSPVVDATTLGAGLLAGLAVGSWKSLDDVAGTWRPARIVEPARQLDRSQWAEAVTRAGRMDSLPVGTRLLELGARPRTIATDHKEQPAWT